MPVPVRTRILLWSALSGLLWALAWPAIGGVAPLAFVAWVPLLHAERLHDAQGVRRAFVPYVLLAALVWNAACSWWFFFVSEPLSTRVVSVAVPVLVNTVLMALPWWGRRFVRRHAGPRMAAVGLVSFWLAMERLHHDWDLQWPWFSLGNVFADVPSWIQWYSVTGMLGGSSWVLVVNLLVHEALRGGVLGGGARWRALPVVASIAVPLAVSQWRYRTHAEEGTPAEVVVVQPNIDPYQEKFGGLDPMGQLEDMLALAEGAMTEGTALVVMPETALQEAVQVDISGPGPVFSGLWENDLAGSRSARRIRAFQSRHPGAAVLVGMSSARLFSPGETLPSTARPMGGSGYSYESYNAAMFLPASGPVEHYRKSKLVAGVEMMPFRSLLGPLDHLALDLGGTTGSLGRQEERSVLRDPSSGMGVVPAICYESVFGEHIAAHVRNGGGLIAIMTNDGWWSDTPGHRQHLSFARIRAIETRRAVARSANTGISCFVDQRGDLHEVTPWWVPDARRHTVHVNDRHTFFVRNGDLVGRAALLISTLLLLFTLGWTLNRRSKGR